MNTDKQLAKTTETYTAQGSIPHLELMTEYGVVRAPVKLKGKRKMGGGDYPLPMRDHNGALVYALPGGGETVG